MASTVTPPTEAPLQVDTAVRKSTLWCAWCSEAYEFGVFKILLCKWLTCDAGNRLSRMRIRPWETTQQATRHRWAKVSQTISMNLGGDIMRLEKEVSLLQISTAFSQIEFGRGETELTGKCSLRVAKWWGEKFELGMRISTRNLIHG